MRNIPCANTYTKRLFGLMGKRNFKGLIFKQNNNNRINASIHTCFMKEKIDLIYVNDEMKIKEQTTLSPWKIYIPKTGNIKYIIELPENTISQYNLELNTKIVIEDEKKHKKQAQKYATNCNEHH